MSKTNRRFVLRRSSVDEALVKATDGAFASALDAVCDEHFDALDERDELTIESEAVPGVRITVRVPKSGVRRVGYSPSQWNLWPGIAPPERKWMRVMGPQKGVKTYRNVLMFKDGEWWDAKGRMTHVPTGSFFKPF